MTSAESILELRAAIDDGSNPPSKSVRQENLRRSVLGDQVDGANKFFQLNNKRIVVNTNTSTLVVISDGSTLTPVSGYTEDDQRGTFTVVGAAPATSLLARYDFTYFSDTELGPFITQGLRFVGYTDVTQLPDGLALPCVKKAAAEAFMALASRYAPVYDSAAGTKKLSKASIKAHWLALRKDATAEATAARDAFYERLGQRNAPASGSFQTRQTAYTPKR